jgi:uncharacterized membrane protein YphA (DoxX/SURF4 family)
MTAATAATWVFAALLALAGARKITAPDATTAALQGARLPSDRRLVRLLGAGEVVAGAAVLGVGGTVPAAVVALAYATFTVFAYRQSRRGAGCGCFGETNAPATGMHVGIDAAGAGAAALAAWRPGPSLVAFAGADLADAIVAVLLLVTATAALRLALTALPELAAAVDLVAPEEAA